MLQAFKKIVKYLFILLSAILLVSTCIIVIFKDKLVDGFKKQIIEKASIDLRVNSIYLSVFENFPYCSVVLKDATLFYPNTNQKDTLISSKKISFSINIINAFKDYYELSLVNISDGYIKIDKDRFKKLFDNDNKQSKLFIETKKIVINNCLLTYSQHNLQFKASTQKSIISGLVKNDAFKLNAKTNCRYLSIKYNDVYYSLNHPLKISTEILGNEISLFSEGGTATINNLPFNFYFKYSVNDQSLKILASTQNADIKDLLNTFFEMKINEINKGSISINTEYFINLNNPTNQKLSFSYSLMNSTINVNKYKIEIPYLNAITLFYNNFKSNSTDIKKINANFCGIDINGSAKVKNYPNSIILLDTKISSSNIVDIYKKYSLSGKINGNIKSLIKLNNFNDLNSILINKINASISFSDVSISATNLLSNLSGELSLDDNNLNINSRGFLRKSAFEGSFSLSNFLDVIYRNKTAYPVIRINLDELNLDELITNNNEKSKTDSLSYKLVAEVKNLHYKGNCYNNVKTLLHSKSQVFTIDTFSMQAFSGSIAGKIPVFKEDKTQINIVFKDIDIKSLFKSFNNFDQKTITSENISGNLSGKSNIFFCYDSKSKVITESIDLESDLIIENGVLTGIDQFNELSKYIRLQQGGTIKFKTLHNNINIKNGIVHIPTMNIASSAMNIELSGDHYFSGNYTYWLKVNLKELLARKFLSNKDVNTEYEYSNKDGLNLYLKLIGDSNSFKISYDRKNASAHIKSNIRSEGKLLKDIIKDEFSKSNKDSSFKTLNETHKNKKDTLNNNSQKKAFKIEWDEIDTTKQL